MHMTNSNTKVNGYGMYFNCLCSNAKKQGTKQWELEILVYKKIPYMIAITETQ